MTEQIGNWRVEKARTSRGSCRACGRAIASGELRFGMESRKTASWFHLECAEEGAPRAFVPFARRIAKLLAQRPKRARTAPNQLPAEVRHALARERVDRAAFAVLTDWLQSNDDPWGALLLLEAGGRRKAAREHLGQHRESLCGSFGRYAFSWKKGFVDEARFRGTPTTLAASIEELAALRTAVRLQRVEIEGSLDAAAYAAIAKLPATLRELRVDWPSKGMEALSSDTLVSLEIRVCGRRDDRLEAATLPALRRVQFVGKGSFMGSARLTVPFLERFLGSAFVKKLKRVEFDRRTLDDEGAELVVAAVRAGLRCVVPPRLG